MASRVQDYYFAVGDASLNKLAHLSRSDDVFAALKYQRWDINLGQVRAVIGCECDPGERFSDFGIGSAKAIGQFLAEFGTVRITHDCRGHLRGPAHVIGFKKLQKLFDLLFAKPTDVIT